MRLRAKLGAALVATALTLFTDHHAIAASPCVTAADSAQDLRATGKLREARAQLVTCSRASCNSVIRADCEKWLKEVDAQTPSLVVRAVDVRGRDVVGVRVTIDDAPIDLDGTPVTVDPGQHVVRGKAKSGDIAEQKTLVVLGEKARVLEIQFNTELTQDGMKPEPVSGHVVKVRPSSQDPPPNGDDDNNNNNNKIQDKKDKGGVDTEAPSQTPVYVLGGIAVVGLSVFGYLEIVAQSNFHDLESTCGQTAAKCSAAQTDPVRTQFIGAGVALGVSVVAIGVAAFLYFTRKPAAASALVDLPSGTFRF